MTRQEAAFREAERAELPPLHSMVARAQRPALPVVTAGDPVQMGLIASLSRPGGNVTGVTQLHEEVASPEWGRLSYAGRQPALVAVSTAGVPQ
jgi:hypothetical protein